MVTALVMILLAAFLFALWRFTRIVRCCRKFPGLLKLDLIRVMTNGWRACQCPHCHSVYLLGPDPRVLQYKLLSAGEWNEANERLRWPERKRNTRTAGASSRPGAGRQTSTRVGRVDVREGRRDAEEQEG